jgi:tRNA-specific 2-thiouridylase
MSGGVDSSVAAALAVEAGYRVFGIMLRLWAEPGAERANRCCTLGAIDDARAVANLLDIPFQVLDIRREFRQLVVEPFLAAAANGDTPNPCFRCNRQVRFGLLLRQARALGADYLATGHYARVERTAGGGWRLLRGVDRAKDQSYMLHRLGQDALAHAMFPVGGHDKAAVRELAARFRLPVASRADSVDLCWVGPDGVQGFLSRNLPPEAVQPGRIVDRDGTPLGRHEGLPLYTRGQRRGLAVAVGEPRYVVERRTVTNELVVGPAEALLADCVRVADVHWVAGTPPDAPRIVEAQIRYRAAAAQGTLSLEGPDGATVRFDRPQRAPTPGQGLVIYDGDEVLGGGRIV